MAYNKITLSVERSTFVQKVLTPDGFRDVPENETEIFDIMILDSKGEELLKCFYHDIEKVREKLEKSPVGTKLDDEFEIHFFERFLELDIVIRQVLLTKIDEIVKCRGVEQSGQRSGVQIPSPLPKITSISENNLFCRK